MNRLGENIRYLRKAHGETQEELGVAINVEKTTISNYEKGLREPDESTLCAIAKHFMITAEELLHQDFSGITKLKFDNKLFFKNIDEILPIICSDNAIQNVKFLKAYEAHKRIYEGLKKYSFDAIDQIDICFEGYMDNENDENAKIESAGNIISISFLLILLMKDTPAIISNPPACLRQIAKSDKSVRDIIDNVDPDFEKDSKGIISELYSNEEFQKMLDNQKYILKQSRKWSDLADYFLALQYVLNLVNNDLTREFNYRVGGEMLSNLISVKNKYAARFLRIAKEAVGLSCSQIVDDK